MPQGEGTNCPKINIYENKGLSTNRDTLSLECSNKMDSLGSGWGNLPKIIK